MPTVYFAPLQGMTTYIYRRAHNRVFGPSIDKYFAPFFMPHEKCNFNFKEIVELGPEENASITLVPQILTRDANEVLRYQKVIQDMGYSELNINLGCPSKTVTGKGRGSAFLIETEELDRFLDRIYEGVKGPISIKTRIGTEKPEEFGRLMEIYNQYPISELTIHPRTMRQFYDGLPVREAFLYALEVSVNPLVYNGDIWTQEDWTKLVEEARLRCPDKEFALMIGRPAVADPALARKIKGLGEDARPEEYKDMLHQLISEYQPVLRTENQVLFRLKELWSWMIRLFPGKEDDLLRLNHTSNIEEYLMAEERMFS